MKISVSNLTKKYREKYALNNVSFELAEPKIYGLLGRNGAGKTTFMDILAGLKLPTMGEVLVDGKIPFDEAEVLDHICLIKEGENFPKDLPGGAVLKTSAKIFPNWDQALAEELVSLYKLPLKKRVKTYSKGMYSALGCIVGLASRAPITIFDEPYIGLDAAARKKFYQRLLEEYEKEPRIIIFSTHLIDEVSSLFEEVLILQDGELIIQEEADKLRQMACAVTGEKAAVEAFIAGKKVIETNQLAHMMTAYVIADRAEAEAAGLTTEGVPIQDLMIYLTEEGSVA